MAHPVYTVVEARTRETFLALMWALSYPGRIHELPDADEPFARIAETLLDLETSYYTPDTALQTVLVHSGAKSLPVETAAYHFYPALLALHLPALRQASVGTMLYPDDGATLIIGAALGEGARFVLQGPGVNGQQSLQVDGLPDAFWELRETACRYPLGWDIFLLDGRRVVGLPRSTRLERM
jgi:alpha-D-ribose 1-methylphosphonate 5-triphosphate synthase subunit PhnH